MIQSPTMSATDLNFFLEITYANKKPSVLLSNLLFVCRRVILKTI